MSTDAPTLMLDAATIDAIARRVIEVQQLTAPAPVLTLAEAMDFTRCRSQSAFDRWLAKWASNARCGHGRYTRAALAKGRDAQARKIVNRRAHTAAKTEGALAA